MKPIVTRWLFLFALIALPMGSALGQVTTATITGTVIDDAGAPLPGANVVAIHQPSGSQYGTTTRLDGDYDLRGLRTGGPYTLTFSFVGFQTVTEEGFTLQLGQTKEVNVTLRETAQELGEVTVLGTPDAVINQDRTGASTNVDEQTIQRLPTISRSIADFARLTPQSTGGNSLAGRNNRYNNIQIDGATLNDVFGLSGTGAPGGQAGAQPIGLDAIQEFNVDIAPYDVRYGGFTGGSINAITRSGTNSFEGSAYFLTRNESFVGSRENDAGEEVEFAEFNERFYGFRLGGPIIENKLFFFVNGEIRQREDPLSTGITGSGAANIFPVDEATLNEIISIAQNQYGYNPGGFDLISQDQDNYKFLAKLDWNISPQHRFTLRHNLVNAEDAEGIGRGQESFDLSNRQYIFNSSQNSTVAQLNSTIGSNIFNEARLVYTRIRDSRDVEAEPFPQVTILPDPDDPDLEVNLGIDRFSQANALDQDLIEITNNLSYITGDHNITVGTSNLIFKFSNLFIQDLYGAYVFESIDDFAAGRPAEYFFSYSLLDDPEPRAEFNAFQVGLYAQDEYQVRPDLKLTFGVRVDMPVFPDEPLDNPLARQAFGISTTNTASGNLLISPRLGFNYTREGDMKMQVRGGTGIFSGRTPFVWISNQYSNTGVDFGRIDENDLPAGCFSASSNPANHPRPGTALGDMCGVGAISTTEINLIDEDFKYPQVWRTNLAVDQQLPWGLIGTLEGIYSKAINEVTYENLNLVQTGTSASGRPIYGQANGFFGNPERRDPNFTNALLLKNTDEGYEYSLTAQLRKKSILGLDGSLSYTYNRAENVNNATSSRAISNWQFNENFDINNPRLGTSDFEVRHRILANVSYRREFSDRLAATLAVVYEGNAGTPFSWIYVGDANADGQNFNDLVYVPASEDEIEFRDDDGSWEELDRFISSQDDLNDARGSVIDRHTSREPWENRVDLRFNLEVFTIERQHVEFTANVFNLFSTESLFSPFGNVAIWDFEGYTADGRPIIEFDDGELDAIREDFDSLFNTSDLGSRWQLQLGLRYTF